MDTAFAGDGAAASAGEGAAESAGIGAAGDVVGESGEEGAAEVFAGEFALGDVDVLAFGDVEELLEGVADLAGGLGVDADLLAGGDGVAVFGGELPGAHEEEEIGLVFLAEEVVAFFLGVGGGAADEEVSGLGEGGGKGDGGGAVGIGSGEEHAGETRVGGEAEHAAAERGDGAVGAESAEFAEEFFGGFEGTRIGGVEPGEVLDVGDSAGFEGENGFGDVDAFDFGEFLGGAMGVFFFGPEAEADSGGGASGASGALIGGGLADFFDEEGVDAAVGIEAGDAGEAGIDDEADAVDGEGGFGDVGGDDDFAAVGAVDGGVLGGGREFAVEREDGAVASVGGGLEGGDGAGDFVGAGHENEDVAFGVGGEEAVGFLGG